MIIQVTAYNTKVPVFINTDKIIKFYNYVDKTGKDARNCTVIDYEAGDDIRMLTIEEDPHWLQDAINAQYKMW